MDSIRIIYTLTPVALSWCLTWAKLKILKKTKMPQNGGSKTTSSTHTQKKWFSVKEYYTKKIKVTQQMNTVKSAIYYNSNTHTQKVDTP